MIPCKLIQARLIAILLGRFRTTVGTCKKEYEEMSHEIFGKPRWMSQLTAVIVPWPKYSAKRMEEVFKEVTKHRCEESAWGVHVYTAPTFPTIENTCATSVALVIP